MLNIAFHPDSDLQEFDNAIKEYERIWEEEGERIVRVWQEKTGLRFQETVINATVFDGKSHSHPLSLRFNIPSERKKSVLVHELGHRLLYDRGKELPKDTLENHKRLYLVLYDVLVALYGKQSADAAVAWDRELASKYPGNEHYVSAWDYALQLKPEERKFEFEKIIRR